MSSGYVKTKLKATREALQQKEYEKAAECARDVLSFEAANYNALVFLGLALLNLGQYKECEETYWKAIKENSQLPLAFQGLYKLYEQQQEWTKLADLLQTNLQAHQQNGDAQKVAETLQRLLDLRRNHGSRSELVSTLSYFLPSSQYYDLLTSLPEPEPTNPTASGIHSIQMLMQDTLPILEEVIAITEADENNKIAAEVDKRRMRLSGTPLSAAETRKLVQRGLMANSRLPSLYEQLLEHPQASDDLRRYTESKLLYHHLTYLQSLPSPFAPALAAATSEAQKETEAKEVKKYSAIKHSVRETVEKLAEGMVLLRVPEPAAWGIRLDWTDVASPDVYETFVLRKHVEIFPPESSPLSTLILGSLTLSGRNKPIEGEDHAEVSKEDPVEMIKNAFENCSFSLLAHVIVAQTYLGLKDWVAVNEVCESGLSLARQREDEMGRRLPLAKHYLSTCLATALVHLDPPTHHRKALRLLTELLQEDPNDQACLLGRGYVLESEERWSEAIQMFEQVLEVQQLDRDTKREVESERAWCLVGMDRMEEGEAGLKAVLEQLNAPLEEGQKPVQDLPTIRAKLWWRLGQCYWKMDDDHRYDAAFAYKAFISSIKCDPLYAPSFTALGIYYLEACDPPDHTRSSKCFQKAFELDPKEDRAARLLVNDFARTEEWDMVEIIARRVLGGISNVGTAGAPVAGGVHARKYAWAWKAVGAADLASQKYGPAITAFQHALRGNPKDVHTWLRLGMAYRGIGKHVAALKTFGHVLSLDPNQWPAKYLAADIQRSIGLLEPAIESLEDLLLEKPDELGVIITLAESRLASARANLRSGQRQHATSQLFSAMDDTLIILKSGKGVRAAWKLVADTASELGKLPVTDGESFPRSEELLGSYLVILREQSIDSKISASTYQVTSSNLEESIPTLAHQAFLVLATVAFQARLIHENANSLTYGAAWLDLGVALHHLRKTPFVSLEEQGKAVIDASLACFREALKGDPRNPLYWNALGVVAFEASPKLCQHAFIRAAEYSPRSAVPWTHLGIFYLHHEDAELANKAFLRAQVLDPDWAHAWLGQACLAALHADSNERRALTGHAWMLASGSLPAADIEYAALLADTDDSLTPADFRPSVPAAINSLERYLQHRPMASDALYLHGVLSERSGLYEASSTSFSQAAASLESDYEHEELEATARHFVLARVGEGRALCAQAEFGQATVSLEAGLGLLGDPEDERGMRIQIQALMLLGLARSLDTGLADKTASLDALEAACAVAESLQDTQWIGRSGISLAKTLWALDTQENKEEAKSKLLSCINDAQTGLPNLEAVTSLAAIATCLQDDELLEAAISEIEGLPADKRLELDPAGEVDRLLVAHHLARDETTQAIEVLSKALHSNPASVATRKELVHNLLRQGQSETAMQLLEPTGQSDTHNDPELLRLQVIAKVLAGSTEPVETAQQAIHLAPWQLENWQALGASTVDTACS